MTRYTNSDKRPASLSIKIAVRDSKGNLKGWKEYETSTGADLASWYERNAWRDTSKRHGHKKRTNLEVYIDMFKELKKMTEGSTQYLMLSDKMGDVYKLLTSAEIRGLKMLNE